MSQKKLYNNYVQIGEYWYNLTDFKHPGGNFLHRLNGTDATHAVFTVHMQPDKIIRKISRYKTKRSLKVSPWLVEYRKLERLGAFNHSFYDLKMLIFFLISTLLTWRLFGYWSVCSTLSGIITCLLTLHEMHNLVHFVVADLGLGERYNRFVMEILCTLIMGTYPYVGYAYDHSLHHIFPNNPDIDPVMNIKPFSFKSNKHNILAWLLWHAILFVLYPLYLFVYNFEAHYRWKGIDTKFCLLILWHIMLIYSNSWFWVWMFTTQWVSVSLFGWMGTLNHFHIPFNYHKNIYKYQISNTQGYELTGIPNMLRFLFGGLDYHQLHHIHTRIPWQKLCYWNRKVIKDWKVRTLKIKDIIVKQWSKLCFLKN